MWDRVKSGASCKAYVFFFFFQAEDGIRDKLVTGVQTCALPISRVCDRLVVATDTREIVGVIERAGYEAVLTSPDHQSGTERSEERRVGKECRSRWSPYH